MCLYGNACNAQISAAWWRFDPKRLNNTSSGSRGGRTHNLNSCILQFVKMASLQAAATQSGDETFRLQQMSYDGSCDTEQEQQNQKKHQLSRKDQLHSLNRGLWVRCKRSKARSLKSMAQVSLVRVYLHVTSQTVQNMVIRGAKRLHSVPPSSI